MKEINLVDILYTGGMFFVIFYGAIAITGLLTKKTDEKEENDDTV